MNRCEAIRALIPDKANAKRMRDIVAALPEYPAQHVRDSITMMFRVEPAILDRIGNRSDGFFYFTIRPVKLKCHATPEERAAAKRRTDAAHHRKRRRQTAEQRAADTKRRREARARMRAQRAEQIAAEKKSTAAVVAAKAQAAREAREAQRAERQRERAIARAQRQHTPAQRMYLQPIAATTSKYAQAVAPIASKARPQTVEEFLAQGGQIEHVPAGWERQRQMEAASSVQ